MTREKWLKGKLVTIQYCPGLDAKEDKAVTKLAEKCGGERTGGGCMLGSSERDIDFEFPTIVKARKFFEQLKTIGY